MKQISVILPLPLDGEFIYAVPDNLEAKAQPGSRVLVPLGKSRKYVGIVSSKPYEKEKAPAAEKGERQDGKLLKIKEIIAALDDSPILLPEQLRLWRWISEYYMSPLGDVMKAALPAGLKQTNGFRPKTERFITLAPQYRNEQSIRGVLDSMQRATRQREVLTTYLQLCGMDSRLSLLLPAGKDIPPASASDSDSGKALKDTLATPIGYDALLNASHSTSAAVRILIDKGILLISHREVGRINSTTEPNPANIKSLNTAQTEALRQIREQMKTHCVTLLHGVTSSGKTEIYIHLIQQEIDAGRQVLYLLPEIALTVQITERLRRVFGNRMAIYHSKYSDRERVEVWQRQLSNHPYDLILGARSAVFLPFQRLSLVIADEEHEPSFKQQEPAPRYHARSTAIVLAGMYHAKTLLGTATPSMESYYNAQQGKYGLVALSQRYKGIELPEIEVVDVKDLRRRRMMLGVFSPRLLAAVKESLGRGEQALLFINRRGFAPLVECPECGWVPKCPNCDVSLTLHKNTNLMSCHYCGYATGVPTQCPNCGSQRVKDRGYGTEKVEDTIRSLISEAHTARMDLDTARTRNAYERLIGDFASGRTNLLIGTQMISKGLDFDRISIVGILNADAMLNYPDFRSYEQAFAMMTQVSGRAGRKGRRGRVILQTMNKDLPIIRQIVHNDQTGFYANLAEERREFAYPPFCRLIYVYLKHRDSGLVETASLELASRLREVFGRRVLGPDKPSVARIKTLSIRKIMLKLEGSLDYRTVRRYLRHTLDEMMADRRYGALQVYFDVDPL